MIGGAADTALCLYDVRATTLTEAILLYGSAALPAGNAIVALSDQNRAKVITFVPSLRSSTAPAKDLLNGADGPGVLLKLEVENRFLRVDGCAFAHRDHQ